MSYKLSISLFIIALLSACAVPEGSKGRSVVESMTSQIGGKSLPEPSPNFQPTDVLPFPSAQVYRAAVAVLDDARISIRSESKEDGRIATDYVAGPSYATALGLLGTNSTRYKYLILIKGSGRGAKLKVTAFLESSGGSAAQSWRDVSQDNQRVVQKIENAMVENIEKQLK